MDYQGLKQLDDDRLAACGLKLTVKESVTAEVGKPNPPWRCLHEKCFTRKHGGESVASALRLRRAFRGASF
ncbi:hypothetical protein D9M70_641830 [compost metagenome]